jgi:dipeptidyl aminopeptidase/acylaminoacyl peptidase
MIHRVARGWVRIQALSEGGFMSVLRGLVLFAAALAVPGPAAAEKRAITETDLFRFVWVADPRISPDGKRVAFTRVTVDAQKEGYDTAIWIVPADGSEPARPFTAGPRDSAPRWSPDGKSLAFLRAGLKDGKPEPPQIHLIPAGGGEARAVSDVPRGAGPPAWSPDGRSLAFVCTANPGDVEKEAKKKEAPGEKDGKDEEERESDVRVITRSVYRFDGRGYLDPERPGHVWVLDLPAEGGTAEAKPLTSGDIDEDNIAWSPDGSRVFFASNRTKDPAQSSPDADLYSLPRAGGEPTREVSIDGPIGDYALSADGRRVAFVGYENAKPVRSYDQLDLFVAERGGAVKNLTTGFDNDVDGGVIGDQRAPRGGLPTPLVWSRDQRFVVVKAAERGRGNLKKVSAALGTVEELTTGDQEVVAYSASADASALAVVISTPTVIGDLFLVDGMNGQMRPLYRPNQELFSELELTAPEELVYTSFDGRRIQAWIQKPPGFVPAQRYPLILNIHGGPHAAYGHVFMHEFQWMAAKGYVVLYPNPRGSSSYGQEFGNVIQYRYPGDDYKDLMAGVDELVRRGIADPARLGVTGGSGGGVLTNWTITRTDRFKAAVSQRSISDWAAWWYTADFTLFQPDWFRGAPFEVPREFAERSAITHVARVKTPLMLVEGEADARTPASAGGEPMFRALKYRKVPTVMVRFPGETHDLSRTGGPWHRVERLRHILGWFDKYLLGRPSIEYDVP